MNYFDTVIKKVVGSNPGFAAKKEAARPNLNRPRQGHRILLLYHICPALSFSKIHSPSLSNTHSLSFPHWNTHRSHLPTSFSIYCFLTFNGVWQTIVLRSIGRWWHSLLPHHLPRYPSKWSPLFLSLSHTQIQLYLGPRQKSIIFYLDDTQKGEKREEWPSQTDWLKREKESREEIVSNSLVLFRTFWFCRFKDF